MSSDNNIIPVVFGTASTKGVLIWNSSENIHNPRYMAFGICEGPLDSINYMVIFGIKISKQELDNFMYEERLGESNQEYSKIMYYAKRYSDSEGRIEDFVKQGMHTGDKGNLLESYNESYRGLAYVVLDMHVIRNIVTKGMGLEEGEIINYSTVQKLSLLS